MVRRQAEDGLRGIYRQHVRHGDLARADRLLYPVWSLPRDPAGRQRGLAEKIEIL